MSEENKRSNNGQVNMNDEKEATSFSYEELQLDALIPWKNNPRQTAISEYGLESLKDDLVRFGQNAPILYFEENGKKYILSGERRWKAAKALDWKTIKAQKIEGTTEELHFRALQDNIQHEAMSPLDIAEAVQKYMTAKGMGQTEFAKMIHKSKQYMTILLAPMDLTSDCKKLVRETSDVSLTRNTLKKIAKSKVEEQLTMLQEAIEKARREKERDETDASGEKKENKADSKRDRTQIKAQHVCKLVNDLQNEVQSLRKSESLLKYIDSEESEALEKYITQLVEYCATLEKKFADKK